MQQFETKNLGSCLKKIHDTVEAIITEPLCVAQVFGSPELDKLCETIGKASLEILLLARDGKITEQSNSQLCVYLVTKLQNSGGHTRVLENFINSSDIKNHVILSTEIAGSSDKSHVKNHFSKYQGVDVEFSPRGNFAEKLMWLQKRLLELNPAKAFLFNHHQDSVAVAAIQPGMGIDTYFYHHGDHHLCLGVHLSHVKHIDIHPMGYHNCREAMGIENIYIPLSVNDKGGLPLDHAFMQDGQLITCTVARLNKIEIPYCENYLEIIPELLAATNGKHVHIGHLTPWGLWKIRRAMRRHGVSYDRFIYISWVPSVWEALRKYRVDVYISSFPYAGALTLVEAMGLGMPVIMHQHAYSRLLSCIDLAYPSAFSWAKKSELIAYCMQLNGETLVHQSKLARQQYEIFHRNEALVKALCENQYVDLPDLACKYQLRQDEWGFFLLRQLSLIHILQRGLYRLARAGRARLQQLYFR